MFVLLVLLFFFIVASWIIFVSYYFIIKQQYYILIIGVLLYLLGFYNHLKCFLSDPGIIPRNHPDYKVKEETNNNDKKEVIKNVNEEINNDLWKNQSQKALIEVKSNITPPDKHDHVESVERKLMEPNNNNNNPQTQNAFHDNEIKKEINLEIKQNQDSNKPELIPNIYRERYCNTCNITRPPKASHCQYCDNCVREFDHHCFFTANCVGLRNHKNFFWFIVCGLIISTFIIATSIAHFIIMFQTQPGLGKSLSNYYQWLIASGVLIGITILSVMLGWRNEYFYFPPATIGLIIFVVIFYIARDPSYNQFENNPFSIVLAFGTMPLFLFASGNFCGQCYLISKGQTTKQAKSIQDFKKGAEGDKKVEIANQQYRDNALYKYETNTCSQKIHNICDFLNREYYKSLIFNE